MIISGRCVCIFFKWYRSGNHWPEDNIRKKRLNLHHSPLSHSTRPWKVNYRTRTFSSMSLKYLWITHRSLIFFCLYRVRLWRRRSRETDSGILNSGITRPGRIYKPSSDFLVKGMTFSKDTLGSLLAPFNSKEQKLWLLVLSLLQSSATLQRKLISAPSVSDHNILDETHDRRWGLKRRISTIMNEYLVF